jgi:L-arabinokinase
MAKSGQDGRVPRLRLHFSNGTWLEKSMRRVFGSTHGLPDTEAFLSELQNARDFLTDASSIVVTRAPGRLDLMGGIADYSGSLVLQLPIAAATHVALQRSSTGALEILSHSHRQTRQFAASLKDIEELTDFRKARERFAVGTRDHWAAYVVGALIVLLREGRLRNVSGARMLITSNVPEGKGVSSSAALEVAVMCAVARAFELDIDGPTTAFLCQRVENLVAGAPCGVMDQMTSSCGEEGRLLALLCQPGELKGTIALPEDLAVWGIDSGIRHAISGADYGTVRTAAFMGYRMIAEIAGLPCRLSETNGVVEIDDDRWNGYPANITPTEFANFAPQLPGMISGEDFLAKYSGITDTVTRVDPEVIYPVYHATRHPVEEHARVSAFAGLLSDCGEREASRLGEMMYESHASYSACGLGSIGTDEIVDLVRQAGASKGLFGAKITGGGSGGTVAILGRRDARSAVDAIARAYSQNGVGQGSLIEGSSPGAIAFGHLLLSRDDARG